MPVFQWGLFFKYLISPDYAAAAVTTLWISLASLGLGLVMGLILAILHDAPLRPLRWLAVFYLWLFRGTPVLLQIVFAFNVLPGFGIVLPGYVCAILALGLNDGAYMAEIMRAGIRAVGPGQRDAAQALGLRTGQAMRFVVLPQALRIIIPPIGNQFIGMLKLSALISVIGVRELLLIADQAAASNFRFFEALGAAGVWYLGLTTVFMVVQNRVEWVLSRSQRTGGRSAPLELQAEAA